MSNEGTTITEDELARAFTSSEFADWVMNPSGTAAHIFHCVARNREPDYMAGWMYRDAEGNYWYRMGDANWILATTGRRYAHEIPVRPLVHLVPDETDKP